jgi:TM2 domain-containing membrane protein YozV
MRRRIYFISAIFSALIIGFGQIIKGDSRRGLVWILLFYFFFPALIYASFLISTYLFVAMLGVAVIVYPLFWLYNVLDALLKRV